MAQTQLKLMVTLLIWLLNELDDADAPPLELSVDEVPPQAAKVIPKIIPPPPPLVPELWFWNQLLAADLSRFGLPKTRPTGWRSLA